MLLENGYKYIINGMTWVKQRSYKCTDGISRQACTANLTSDYAIHFGNTQFRLGKLNYTESGLTNAKYTDYADVTDRVNTGSPGVDPNKVYSSNIIGLWIGRGATQPTFTDYQMEDAILFAEMPITSKARFFNSEKYIEIAYTFHNITEEDITVTELGLYTFAGSTATSWNQSIPIYPALLARKIIDPVTVGAGYYSTFNYRIYLGTPEV